jgi:hypothetical protein
MNRYGLQLGLIVAALLVLGSYKALAQSSCCPSSGSSSNCRCPELDCCEVWYDGPDYSINVQVTQRCEPMGSCPQVDVCIFNEVYDVCNIAAPFCTFTFCNSCPYITGCVWLNTPTTNCSGSYGLPPAACKCPGIGCTAIDQEVCSVDPNTGQQSRTALPTIYQCP